MRHTHDIHSAVISEHEQVQQTKLRIRVSQSGASC